jgi:hypothetical protein
MSDDDMVLRSRMLSHRPLAAAKARFIHVPRNAVKSPAPCRSAAPEFHAVSLVSAALNSTGSYFFFPLCARMAGS